MIVTELVENGERIRSYSDRGVYIHGGFPEGDYEDAIDPVDAMRTYVETDIPIEDEVSADEALNILLGGAT